MSDLIGFLVAAIVAVPAGTYMREKMRRRIENAGKFEVALRVVSGDADGISRKWRHGKASASLAFLTFERGGPLGARVPRTGTFVYAVTEATVDGDRRPQMREGVEHQPEPADRDSSNLRRRD